MQNSTMPLDLPVDNRIRIRINAEIRIRTPDHFWLRCWPFLAQVGGGLQCSSNMWTTLEVDQHIENIVDILPISIYRYRLLFPSF